MVTGIVFKLGAEVLSSLMIYLRQEGFQSGPASRPLWLRLEGRSLDALWLVGLTRSVTDWAHFTVTTLTEQDISHHNTLCLIIGVEKSVNQDEAVLKSIGLLNH